MLPGRAALARGIRKADLAGTVWLPDVGPSHELRRWLGHDPDRWDEFRRRYFAELDQHPDAVALREYLLSQVERTR